MLNEYINDYWSNEINLTGNVSIKLPTDMIIGKLENQPEDRVVYAYHKKDGKPKEDTKSNSGYYEQGDCKFLIHIYTYEDFMTERLPIYIKFDRPFEEVQEQFKTHFSNLTDRIIKAEDRFKYGQKIWVKIKPEESKVISHIIYCIDVSFDVTTISITAQDMQDEDVEKICSRIYDHISFDYKGPIYYTDNGKTLNRYATNLSNAEVPRYVKRIAGFAFEECKYLTNVVLHEGLVEIDDCAFYESYLMESVTIPKSVRYIGDLAFRTVSEIRGVKGSEAERYANKERIDFVDIETGARTNRPLRRILKEKKRKSYLEKLFK